MDRIVLPKTFTVLNWLHSLSPRYLGLWNYVYECEFLCKFEKLMVF